MDFRGRYFAKTGPRTPSPECLLPLLKFPFLMEFQRSSCSTLFSSKKLHYFVVLSHIVLLVFLTPTKKSMDFFTYIIVIHTTVSNQLKKTSVIGLPKFTIVIWLKNTVNMQILVQKICFLRITILEARCQMVFLTDPEFFCI